MSKQEGGILVVRLGAMGDVIHTLPAAASLKHSFPAARLTWVVDPAWMPLLAGNPFVDELVAFDRKQPRTWLGTRKALLRNRYSLAVDFQGLLKSALVASAARPERILGFSAAEARERAATFFYSQTAEAGVVHAVDRNLALAQAAGAATLLRQFPLPSGLPEGNLPREGFVLASPLAGWGSKQWPLENYARLAVLIRQELGLPLVLNGPPQARSLLEAVPGTVVHLSGLSGLIDATRRATAVVGVDSGPMHLAAALNKAGAALFGPTCPERNGPYGGTLQVLRHQTAAPRLQRADSRSGAYIRSQEVDPAMRAITPADVMNVLKVQAACPV